jgi:hypothetical protein
VTGGIIGRMLEDRPCRVIGPRDDLLAAPDGVDAPVHDASAEPALAA